MQDLETTSWAFGRLSLGSSDRPLQRMMQEPPEIHDREEILLGVYLLDPRVLAGINTVCLAALGVPHHIARLVALSPLPVRSGDLLAWYEHKRAVLNGSDLSCGLHGPVDHLVDLH